MKLGLGTAQFGMAYGISNQKGKISTAEARRILTLAAKNGIDVLDTAAAYGDSEIAVGQALTDLPSFRIVTKARSLHARHAAPYSAGLLRDDLHQSLRNLQRKSVYGYLMHDARDFLNLEAHQLIETLREFRQQGLVEKVGVSVYTAAEIDRILEVFVPDIIQVPVSIFDQRLMASGHLAELKRGGVEIHARSIFLQGLLLMEVGNMPDFCLPVAEHFEKFARFTQESGLTRLDAALAFIAQIAEIDVALVGVTSLQELEEIIRAVAGNASRNVRIPNASAWAIGDERIVNPGLWPTQSAVQRA